MAVTLIGILVIPAPFIVLMVIRCVRNIKDTAKESLY